MKYFKLNDYSALKVSKFKELCSPTFIYCYKMFLTGLVKLKSNLNLFLSKFYNILS